MRNLVRYTQLNKDHAFWFERRRIGQDKGGCVAGLLTHIQDGTVRQNLLIDCGFGTVESVADACARGLLSEQDFWDRPLAVLVTHGHIDHHAELMILSEYYCQRRGSSLHDVRPPLPVYSTLETQNHLGRVHYYGYGKGNTLTPRPISPHKLFGVGPFQILPVPVDHFEGAVFYAIRFGTHKLVICWDLTGPPADELARLALVSPSLALVEATTWCAMAEETTHAGIEALVETGFIERLELEYDPAREKYGAYLVHYSGWEDSFGMLTEGQLKMRFDVAYPRLAGFVRVAARGQYWDFTLGDPS